MFPQGKAIGNRIFGSVPRIVLYRELRFERGIQLNQTILGTFVTKARLTVLFGVLVSLIAGAAYAQPVTLELWNPNTNERTQAWYEFEFKPAFESAYPGVELVLSFPSFSDYFDKVTVAAAAGTGPDVLTSNNALFLANGIVSPLDHLLDQWDLASDFLGTSLNLAAFQGQTYGLPLGLATRTMVYNRYLFLDSGLDADNPPTSWEDYRTSVQRLTRWNSDRTVLEQAGTVQASNHQGGFDAYIHQAGGAILNEDGTAGFATAAGVEALEFWGDLFREYAPPGLAIQDLLTGKVAIHPYTNATVFANARDRAPDMLDALAVAPRPLERYRTMVPVFGAPIGISAHTEHPDLAWELVKFHFRPDMLAGYNREFGFLPPTRAGLEELLSSTDAPWLPIYADHTNQYGVGVWSYSSAHFQEVFPLLQNAITQYIQGEGSAQSLLEDAARRWNAIVSERR